MWIVETVVNLIEFSCVWYRKIQIRNKHPHGVRVIVDVKGRDRLNDICYIVDYSVHLPELQSPRTSLSGLCIGKFGSKNLTYLTLASKHIFDKSEEEKSPFLGTTHICCTKIHFFEVPVLYESDIRGGLSVLAFENVPGLRLREIRPQPSIRK